MTAASPAAARPALDVIVAVHDEAALIDGKLADLAALAWPAGEVRFWIVDGASQDGTRERVRGFAERDARFRLLALDVADKTAQLNAALALARAPWVVVTDADARLAPDALSVLIAAGEADPEIAAVGTAVRPRAAHPLEQLYWRAANALRRAEARRGSASIVIAGCYAFRRELVPRLPVDVLSDDVHVALRAAATGRRVAFAEVTAEELRAPRTLRQLFHHKRRKAHGYLREVLRFLPSVPQMRGTARAVFLWRAAALLVAPPLAAAAVLALSAALARGVHGDPRSVATLAAPLLLAGGAVAARGRPQAGAWVVLGGLLAAVQLATLLAHPFARLRPCFPRVAGGGGPAGGRGA
jgi:cellulose synthase/poly-beta-1,6-N-acetylglucosamine synthase-like glycosyltransferase